MRTTAQQTNFLDELAIDLLAGGTEFQTDKAKVLVLDEKYHRTIIVALASWSAYARRSNEPDVGRECLELCQEIRRQLGNQESTICVVGRLNKKMTIIPFESV